MQNSSKKILGITVAGSNYYENSSYVCMLSFLRYNNELIDEIWIISDKHHRKFENIKNFILQLYNKEIRIIRPPSINKLSKLKTQNDTFYTYYKFELFSNLCDNDFMIFLDSDIIVKKKININIIHDEIKRSKFKIAAIPAQRPVLETFSHLNLANPFDYFNCGVLFVFYDKKFEIDFVINQYKKINAIIEDKIIWHDQCLFNYIFKNQYFKLPPIYNVHAGYIQKQYNSPSKINVLLQKYIFQHYKIIHFSGGALGKKIYHPFKKHYHDEVKYIKQKIIELNFISFINFKTIDYKFAKLDYYLQVFYLKKRIFSDIYYPSLYIRFKQIIKKSFKL